MTRKKKRVKDVVFDLMAILKINPNSTWVKGHRRRKPRKKKKRWRKKK